MTALPSNPWDDYRRNPTEKNFRPIYEETKGMAYTLCYRILGNEEDAWEAFQSTYGRLLSLRRESGPAGRFEDIRWAVGRLAIREADSLRKRRGRRERKVGVLDPLSAPFMAEEDPNPTPREAAERRELRERMEAIVAGLDEIHRLPVIFHYFHGMTHQQIADLLETPVNTISTRIARALKKLEPQFRKAGFSGTAALGAILGGMELVSPPAGLTAAVVYSAAHAMLSAGGGTGVALAGAGLWKGTLAGAILSTKGGIFVSGISLGVLVFVAFAFTRLTHESQKPQSDAAAEIKTLTPPPGTNASSDSGSKERDLTARPPAMLAQAVSNKGAATRAAAPSADDSGGKGELSTPPKVGVIFSERTAHGPAPSQGAISGNMEGIYNYSSLTAVALQGLGFEVYAVVEPGTKTDSDLVRSLQQCEVSIERVLDGSDPKALGTLDSVMAPYLHNIEPRTLKAIRDAVKEGLGFTCLGDFGYNSGNSDVLEDLMGLRQTPENFRVYEQSVTCQIVAPEEMRIGLLASMTDLTFRYIFGFTGPVDGTPLLMLPPEVDDAFSVGYYRQCGKGRVGVMQGVFFISGAQALTLVRLAQYFTNWASHRPMEKSWKPLNLSAMLQKAGISPSQLPPALQAALQTAGAQIANEEATPAPPLKAGLILSQIGMERPGFKMRRFDPAIYPTALKFIATAANLTGTDTYLVLDKDARSDPQTRTLMDIADIKDDHALDGTDADAIKGLGVIISLYNPSLTEALLDALTIAIRSGVGFISIGKIAGATPEANAALENIIGLDPDGKNLVSLDGDFPVKLVENVPQAAGLFPAAQGFRAYHLEGYKGDPAAVEGTPILAAQDGAAGGICPAYIRKLGYGRVLICQFSDFATLPENAGLAGSLGAPVVMDQSLFTASSWAAARP